LGDMGMAGNGEIGCGRQRRIQSNPF
jgi:hypothetical protein